jgi:soluble lytic murein transglycosylase-like protein
VRVERLPDGRLVVYNLAGANGAARAQSPPAPPGRALPPAPTPAAPQIRPAVLRRYDPGFLAPLIDRHSDDHGLDPRLVAAVVQVESAFDGNAVSRKGAIGLMQLMPETAAVLAVDDPYDPDQNLRGGTAYLRRLLDRYDGRLELALAAYNAGPEAVDRYGGVPPYAETRDYVRRVLRLYEGGEIDVPAYLRPSPRLLRDGEDHLVLTNLPAR